MKEVQRLTSRLATLSKFISRATNRNLPFLKVLRHAKTFKWTEECERVFAKLKAYLTNPPLLSKPKPNEVLFLYLAVSPTALSAALVCEDGGAQLSVYYVSNALVSMESRYQDIKKLTFTILMLSHNLCPYFQAHVIVVMTSYPLGQVLYKPNASGKLMKWSVNLDSSR